MGTSAVAATTGDYGFEVLAESRSRSSCHADLPNYATWIDMLSNNRVDPIQSTLLNKILRAVSYFLRGLENRPPSSWYARLLSVHRHNCPKQHGGVSIMPTSMHFPRALGPIRRVRFFVDRQRINVST